MRKSFTIEQKEERTRKFHKDLSTLSMKQRNGLFSDPMSLAVGDIHYVAPKRKRDQHGNVPVKAKSFFASKMQKGHTDSALFSKPAYNGINDPYNEPNKSLKLRSSVEGRSKNRPFTAGGRVKYKPKPTLENSRNSICIIGKESKRIGPGNVRLKKPNFVTSKSKIGGGHTTPGVCIGGKNFRYMEDDYDREKDNKREKSRQHKEKIPRPFSSTVRQRTTFTKDQQCYTIEGLTLKLKNRTINNYQK